MKAHGVVCHSIVEVFQWELPPLSKQEGRAVLARQLVLFGLVATDLIYRVFCHHLSTEQQTENARALIQPASPALNFRLNYFLHSLRASHHHGSIARDHLHHYSHHHHGGGARKNDGVDEGDDVRLYERHDNGEAPHEKEQRHS